MTPPSRCGARLGWCVCRRPWRARRGPAVSFQTGWVATRTVWTEGRDWGSLRVYVLCVPPVSGFCLRSQRHHPPCLQQTGDVMSLMRLTRTEITTDCCAMDSSNHICHQCAQDRHPVMLLGDVLCFYCNSTSEQAWRKIPALGCKCDLSCSCGTLWLWLSSGDKTLELRGVSFSNSYICDLTSMFRGIQNPFKAKKGRWNLALLQPGSAFRYITSFFFFFLSPIYFILELLINEDLSLNSMRRGRTTFCIVFYLSFVGGRHYYISMKLFTDSEVHP